MSEDQVNATLSQPEQRAAKRLLRLSRSLILAPLDSASGQPVLKQQVAATDSDGSLLLFLHAQSEQHGLLAAAGRCNVLLVAAGSAVERAQLAIEARARVLADDEAARASIRWQACHPGQEAVLADANRVLWSLRPMRSTFYDDAGMIHILEPGALLTACADWTAWHEREAGAVAHMNEDHLDATALYAHVLCEAPHGEWLITGLDPDGIDMRCGGQPLRYCYEQPLENAEGLRPRLVALVKEARVRSLRAN